MSSCSLFINKFSVAEHYLQTMKKGMNLLEIIFLQRVPHMLMSTVATFFPKFLSYGRYTHYGFRRWLHSITVSMETNRIILQESVIIKAYSMYSPSTKQSFDCTLKCKLKDLQFYNCRSSFIRHYIGVLLLQDRTGKLDKAVSRSVQSTRAWMVVLSYKL